MALTKVSRGLLSTGIVDNSNATAITLNADESATFAGSISVTGTITSTAFGSQLATTLFQQNVLKSSVASSAGAFIRMAVSGAGNPTYAFEDDTNTGMFTSGADTLNFATAGTERMRLSGGSVGIGVSNPSDYYANNLVVTGPSEGGITIASTGNHTNYLLFADSTSGVARYAGMIEYAHSLDQMAFRTNSIQRMAISNTGNVGIGTGSSAPSNLLHLHNTSGDSIIRMSGGGGLGINYGGFVNGYGVTGTGGYLDLGVIDANFFRTAIQVRQQAAEIIFKNGDTERMRLSGGNLLVGKSALNFATAGTEIMDHGEIQVTRASGVPMYLRRNSSDGAILSFYKDGTAVGSVDTKDGDLAIGTGTCGIRFNDGANAVIPFNITTNSQTDNTLDLGFGSLRWQDIFATNGTIQTSDRNEKQDIAELTDAEQRVAVAAKGLMRKFRWIDSVAEKGDEARIHFGIIAQDLQAAFEAEGLDAGRYAMFTSNTWTDEDTGEERTRLGVRYSELLAFIISAI